MHGSHSYITKSSLLLCWDVRVEFVEGFEYIWVSSGFDVGTFRLFPSGAGNKPRPSSRVAFKTGSEGRPSRV